MAQRRARLHIYCIIDKVFFREREIRQAVHDARADRGGQHPRSGTPDPTAAEAIARILPIRAVTLHGGMRVEWPESWLAVIDATYSWLDDIRREVARDRYQGQDYRRTCMRLHITQCTYSNAIRDIRTYAAIAAAQLGLVKIV